MNVIIALMTHLHCVQVLCAQLGFFFPPGILAVTLRTVLSTVEGNFFFFCQNVIFQRDTLFSQCIV